MMYHYIIGEHNNYTINVHCLTEDSKFLYPIAYEHVFHVKISPSTNKL